MSSLRRILSSRANGALSRGPLTPEGKRRSSQNAIHHGLLSDCVVLPGESLDTFAEVLAQHVDRFAPADGVELGMIEEMAAAYWRLRRSWAIENALLASSGVCVSRRLSDGQLCRFERSSSVYAASRALVEYPPTSRALRSFLPPLCEKLARYSHGPWPAACRAIRQSRF